MTTTVDKGTNLLLRLDTGLTCEAICTASFGFTTTCRYYEFIGMVVETGEFIKFVLNSNEVFIIDRIENLHFLTMSETRQFLEDLGNVYILGVLGDVYCHKSGIVLKHDNTYIKIMLPPNPSGGAIPYVYVSKIDWNGMNEFGLPISGWDRIHIPEGYAGDIIWRVEAHTAFHKLDAKTFNHYFAPRFSHDYVDPYDVVGVYAETTSGTIGLYDFHSDVSRSDHGNGIHVDTL